MAEVASSPSATATVAVNTADWWLKNVTTPSLNLKVDVADITTATGEKQAVFRPLGRTRSVVVSDGISGTTGTLNVSVVRSTESAALRALIDSTDVLLLQSPYGEQYYIRLTSDRARKIAQGTSDSLYQEFSFGFTEVDAP